MAAKNPLKTRFANHSEDEIKRKTMMLIPENTRRANEKAARSFRLYLSEKNLRTNFEDYEAVELNEVLQKFYFDARTVTGQYYKASSLENLRHSLNRYLKSPPHCRLDLDIISDSRFHKANEAYKSAIKELKANGYGKVDHHPRIKECDLEKIYEKLEERIGSPTGLMQKVQFDIRLYFCRRGMENMYSMDKNTFAIKTDPNTGVKYVYKRMDELAKNHQGIEEGYTGFMTEKPGNSMCPVASYEKLLSVSGN
jgi:hypothetical protein